ncbi:hypothetical protein ACVWY2_004315 [Bradyrhizobium sp. JR6.1]
MKEPANRGGLTSCAQKAGCRNQNYEAGPGDGNEGEEIPDAIHAGLTRTRPDGSVSGQASRWFGAPYSSFSVHVCSLHWHLNMRTVLPFFTFSVFSSSLGVRPH